MELTSRSVRTRTRLQQLGFSVQGAMQLVTGQMVINADDRHLLAELLQRAGSTQGNKPTDIGKIFEDNARTARIR